MLSTVPDRPHPFISRGIMTNNTVRLPAPVQMALDLLVRIETLHYTATLSPEDRTELINAVESLIALINVRGIRFEHIGTTADDVAALVVMIEARLLNELEEAVDTDAAVTKLRGLMAKQGLTFAALANEHTAFETLRQPQMFPLAEGSRKTANRAEFATFVAQTHDSVMRRMPVGAYARRATVTGMRAVSL